VAAGDSDAYVDYMRTTGLRDYAATPGNLAAHMLLRDTGDGRTEVVMLTLWESMDAVRQFAGERPELAVFYPEDDRFLVAREKTTAHYEVALTTERSNA
jgi:heme-degrading monooxygenase HmoA